MPDNAEKLIKLISLGLDRFGQLTAAEINLFRAAANGEVAEFRVRNGLLNPPVYGESNHPHFANKWGDDRLVHADRIAWLCGISNTENLLTERGIVISGAKIYGPLHLDNSVVNVPLAFSHCVFSDAIFLRHAKTRMLEFQLTYFKSINADGIQVDGLVRLKNGCQAIGMISLYGATINGDFEFEYSRVFNPGDDAIRGIGLDVKGHIRLSHSKIIGRVHLYQAKIGGNLDCYNTKIGSPGTEALLATGLNVGGAIFFSGIFPTRGFVTIGSVIITFATIGGNLDCENGRFIHRPKIENKDTQVSALDLECSNIRGYLLLRNGFLSDGRVSFVNATIGAHLDCQGGRFVNPGGYAILGNNVRVLNGLLLRNGFHAEGEVRLSAATIGGNMECVGGQFVNSSGNALDAERSHVSGHLLLKAPFKAEGTVKLYATTIRGDVRCDGGQFICTKGNALEMERANVNGHLSLGGGFRAQGMVSLSRAKIGGNLECVGGEFSCGEAKSSMSRPSDLGFRCAIQVESADIGGSVMMRALLDDDNTGKPFVADGTVYLLNSRVGGNVDCRGGAFLNEKGDALVLGGAQIAGDLLLGPGFHANGRLNLSGLTIDRVCCMLKFVEAEKITSLDIRFTNVATLYHDPDSWPQAEGLLLNGLIYKNVSFSGGVSIDGLAYKNDFVGPRFLENSKAFIEWLRLQPTKPIALQPYEQLAKVLKSSGYESEATEVLIAKQDDLLRHGDLGFGKKFWKWILKITIVYGYKPHFALLWVLGFMFLGAILFKMGRDHKLMIQTRDLPGAAKSKEAYPEFHALVYSGEFFVPIVNLRQRSYWAPAESKGHVIVKYPQKLRWGFLLTMYFWFQTCLGWTLTTIWVAGFTGLVRRLN